MKEREWHIQHLETLNKRLSEQVEQTTADNLKLSMQCEQMSLENQKLHSKWNAQLNGKSAELEVSQKANRALVEKSRASQHRLNDANSKMNALCEAYDGLSEQQSALCAQIEHTKLANKGLPGRQPRLRSALIFCD